MKRYTLIISLVFLTYYSHGQTLQELLKQAEAKYPLLKAKGYEVQAREDQVSLAKAQPCIA
jgi:hypothetical protein